MKRSWYATPYAVWMLLFAVVPLLFVCWYAFTTPEGAFTLANFQEFSKPRYAGIILRSLKLALYCTALCLVIGYPTAWFLSGRGFSRAQSLVVLILLPMWMNLLLRTYAMMTLLDDNGVLNAALAALLLPKIKVIGTEGAVVMGLVYNYLPFMILPIYTVLQKLDKSYIEAAQDLGADNIKVFTKVTLPLSMPGVVSGIMMVFMPTISTFAIAELLTMNNIKLFGTIIQENINNGMWNYGAALALIMLVIIGLTTLLSDSGKEVEDETGGLI